MSERSEAEESRKIYARAELDERTVNKNPFEQFDRWYKDVQKCGIVEPTAMILATASAAGTPSVRTVLLKSYDKDGFVFYTNYESKKGKELEVNPKAGLLFLWKEIGRQVRIEGSVEKVMKEESEEYFRSRPKESQLGAWASKQSTLIPSREHLLEEYEKYREQFEGSEVPLPPHWGGFRVIPAEFEFWQGRENRLNDRICYTKKGYGWHIARLSP
jgi:pyridoxamine 5'-phosphate oxidase